MKKKGYLFVLMAAMCWATLGLFGNTLMSLGLIPEQVAFLRLFVGFLILTIYALIKNPTILKINKKGFIFIYSFSIYFPSIYSIILKNNI